MRDFVKHFPPRTRPYDHSEGVTEGCILSEGVRKKTCALKFREYNIVEADSKAKPNNTLLLLLYIYIQR